MQQAEKTALFQKADIMVFSGKSPEDFAVVACDQYTSEPAYWDRVKTRTQNIPSAFHMIFPEIWLKTGDFDRTIVNINSNMTNTINRGLFKEYKDSLFYVERVLRNGKIRRGLIGKIDLEGYDFLPDSNSPIRATEGTVLERIPPRVRIRRDAPLELPHVMVLIDDPQKEIIEPLMENKAALKRLYSFELMELSGRLSGYLISDDEAERILEKLSKLGEKEEFNRKYQMPDKPVLQFAVGDGNHSLATAKQCYTELKAKIGEEAALSHPARYALIELVNLHDESLEFEAVHRVLFQIDPKKFKEALLNRFTFEKPETEDCQTVTLVKGEESFPLYLINPTHSLAVGTLQNFLDDYLAENEGSIDYIHGEEVVRSLCIPENSVGFLLPCMEKDELYPAVIKDGTLPRKTFSMGEACDKRFYFEARKIK